MTAPLTPTPLSEAVARLRKLHHPDIQLLLAAVSQGQQNATVKALWAEQTEALRACVTRHDLRGYGKLLHVVVCDALDKALSRSSATETSRG